MEKKSKILNQNEIAFKYAYGRHDALTDNQEEIDMADDILKFAEAWHKEKVESITDKELIDLMGIDNYHSNHSRRAYILGFNTFKNILISKSPKWEFKYIDGLTFTKCAAKPGAVKLYFTDEYGNWYDSNFNLIDKIPTNE